MTDVKFDPGLVNLREATVTMVATLASFSTALFIEHLAQLSSSDAILAVALTLSIGRMGERAGHRTVRATALAALVLALVAVCASEISTRIFRQPDLGDALFVVAISGTIWLRRFGPAARQIATFATFPLVAMLVVPAPVVTTNGSAASGPWWSALIAVIALGWVDAARFAAERSGVLVPVANRHALIAPVAPSAPSGRRRIAPSTKMALQLAAALGAAFVVGRNLFGAHWTWVVLTAFIVCSGNRGRGDVAHKAAMRLVGASVGTLVATVLSGALSSGDRWSIVIIFAVLAVALWLRSVNYAFWATGMTAALALLYGYYGQGGVGLLGMRLEGILVGAALAVASSWLLLPIRTSDIIRRDIAAALTALDEYLEALQEDPPSAPTRQDRFGHAVSALNHVRALLRVVPARLRSRVDHLPAVEALDECAKVLPAVTTVLASRSPDTHWRVRLDDLRVAISELRKTNARRDLPDVPAWARLATAIGELARTSELPTPTSSSRDRFWESSKKVLTFANRMHATTYGLVSELDQDGPVLTYLVKDGSGQQAHLIWSRDATLSSVAQGAQVVEARTVEIAAGRTPSGYPYKLTSFRR